MCRLLLAWVEYTFFLKMLGLSPYSLLSHKNWPNAYFYIVTDAKSALLPAFLWQTGILLINRFSYKMLLKKLVKLTQID